MPTAHQVPHVLFHLGYDNDRGGICSFLRALSTASAPLLAESDVLIVPADREAFSLARIEALALGVPSVSADSGGARDFISPPLSPPQPPLNGWLFRNNDATDLARVLAQLSAPAALAAVRIDRGLLRRLTPGASAAQHAAFYATVLAGG